MDATLLENYKQFELAIKKIIMAEFENIFPEDTIRFLNEDSVITEENIKTEITLENFQSKIIKMIFDAIINVRCENNLTVNGKLYTNAKYGDFLEDGLIEYYTNYIANEFGIDIVPSEAMKENLDYIKALKDRLENSLAFMTFNNNAIEILEKASSPELTALSDNKAIEMLLDGSELLENEKEEKIVEETNKISPDGQINIVYLKGKQHVKYLDADGKVHLVETRQPHEVSRIYRSLMKKLGKDGDLNCEEFFKELTLNHEEIDLNSDTSIDRSKLNAVETNMLEAIENDEEVIVEKENDEVTHNLEEGIHVVEKTNEIITTDVNNGQIVKEKFEDIKKDAPITVTPVMEAQKVEKTRLITEDEYEKYCMKVINGKKLTDVELEEMEYFDKYYYGETSDLVASEKGKDIKEETQAEVKEQTTKVQEVVTTPETVVEETVANAQEQVVVDAIAQEEVVNAEGQTTLEEGPKLTMKPNNKKSGFSTKMFLLIVIPITICVGVISGIMVFKLVGQ